MLHRRNTYVYRSLFNSFWGIGHHGHKLFVPFKTTHLVVLAIVALVLTSFVIFKNFYQRLYHRRVEFCLGMILLIQQVLMYSWYITYRADLTESLPFYLSRIAILFTAYTLITGKDKFTFITCIWGVMSGIMALFIVDTNGYNFPHFLFFSFFVGHGVLLIGALYIIIIKEYRLDLNDYKKITIANLLYVVVVSGVNRLLHSNYHYLERPPEHFIPIPPQLFGCLFYRLCIFLIMQAICSAVFICIRKRKLTDHNTLIQRDRAI